MPVVLQAFEGKNQRLLPKDDLGACGGLSFLELE